jgi:hypothetical protein
MAKRLHCTSIHRTSFALTIDTSFVPAAQAIVLYATGLAYAAQGDLGKARELLGDLNDAVRRIPVDYPEPWVSGLHPRCRSLPIAVAHGVVHRDWRRLGLALYMYTEPAG